MSVSKCYFTLFIINKLWIAYTKLLCPCPKSAICQESRFELCSLDKIIKGLLHWLSGMKD